MRTIKFRGIPTNVMFANIDDGGGVDLDNKRSLELGEYDGLFVYGNLIAKKDEDFIVGSILDDEYGSLKYWIPVIPETVGQFVGETDTFEKEIYEGDIIEFFAQKWNYDDDNNYYPNHAIVSYSSEEMKFYLEEDGTGECWKKGYVHYGNYECLEECEVIGNIYGKEEQK